MSDSVGEHADGSGELRYAYQQRNTFCLITKGLLTAAGCLLFAAAIITLSVTYSFLGNAVETTNENMDLYTTSYNVEWQQQLIINSTSSVSHSAYIQLNISLPERESSLLTLCLNETSNLTAYAQVGIPPTENYWIPYNIPHCSHGGVVIASNSIPICSELPVYVVVDSVAASEQEFSLSVFLGTCGGSTTCSCNSVIGMVSIYSLFVFFFIFSTCCGCAQCFISGIFFLACGVVHWIDKQYRPVGYENIILNSESDIVSYGPTDSSA